MPKITDSTCPLGFHPQFRRPNYCKRCFREYSEHKSVKEGSTTSVNSLNLDRRDDHYGSKGSLSSVNRSKDGEDGHSKPGTLSRSSSLDEDATQNSWSKSKPMSWSAQDLRKAVDEAKYTVRSTKEASTRHYGSARSLTQELGSLPSLNENCSTSPHENGSEESIEEPSKVTSFSSYLSARTKSPVRPSLVRMASLPSDTSCKFSEDAEPKQETVSSSDNKYVGGGRGVRYSSSLKIEKPKLAPLQETPEMTRSEKSPKIIQSLREVKSEDADAAYVIQIRPNRKKEELSIKKKEREKEPKDLNKQIKDLKIEKEQLENEKNELMAKPTRYGEVKKQVEISKLQSKIDEVNDEIRRKNREVKEIDKRLPSKDVEKTVDELKGKLRSAEQLCEELMDENEECKKEIRILEDEIEEMQDNFREDQADEYRDLKRELEQRAKDCRVLQFKLRKTERRSEQLENEKLESEEKLKELQVGEGDRNRTDKIKALEKELNLAKEVSMKMHEEMEKMRNQLELAKLDKKKLEEPLIKPGAKVNRSQMMGRQGSQDNTDQLLRDLQDALEREHDLKDQFKFAEEETNSLRKKVSRLEEETETLQLQLNKMSSKAKQSRQRSLERSGSTERAGSVERGSLSRQGSTEKPPIPTVNGEDIDPTELKIQLELNEQESAILRRKVEDLESENLRLQKKLKEFLTADFKKHDNVPEFSKDNLQLNKKLQLLEEECLELRNKILSSEKEKDRLKVEVEASKQSAKDLGNRIQESEVNAYQVKIKELEETNEKLLDENVKLNLKTQKRLPLNMQENAYVEKQVLEDRVKRMEKKLKDAQDKLKTAGYFKDVDSNSKDKKIQELQCIIDEVQAHCKSLEKENEEMKDTSGYKNRIPKIPKDTTPRATLAKWVSDLEKECAKLYATVKLKETETQVLQSMPMTKRETKTSVDGEMCHLLFNECETLKSKNEFFKTKLESKETECSNLNKKQSQLENDLKHANETVAKLQKYEAILNNSIKEVNWQGNQVNDFTSKSSLKKMVQDLGKECATLHTSLKCVQENNKESTKLVELREKLKKEEARTEELIRKLKEVDSKTKKLDEPKILLSEKLQQELSSCQEKIAALERKVSESGQKLKLSENSEKNLRSLLEQAESRLEEEISTQSSLEGRQKNMTVSWLKERDELKTEAKKAQQMVRSLETQLQDEKKKIEKLEGKSKHENDEFKKLGKENYCLQIELDEIRNLLNKLEKENKTYSKQEKEMEHFRKENEDLKIRMNTLETELKTEKKKRERIESDSTIGMKGKLSEIENYTSKIQKLETENRKLNAEFTCSCQEYENKIKSLEKKLNKEKKDLEELIVKYNELEDILTCEKNKNNKINKDEDFPAIRKEFETLQNELKTLRETYNNHQDKWIKEKLDMQIQLKDMEEKTGRNCETTQYSEKLRLRNIIDDKNHQLENLKVETETLKDQLTYSRRESEDIRRKVDDLEKLQGIAEKRQSSVSLDTKGYESTIKDLKSRLTAIEKSNKSEVTKMKMRYDTKLKLLNEELSTVTQHMSKYRRERDTYKEMLNGAQKTIADLKGGGNTYRSSRADNATEAKAHLTEIQDLQSNLTEAEDKLADSRLDVTKLKNQLVDQKTGFEIQLSDMQTKLNEYEEDRLLGGGGRRVPGLRTRLELNWQKEREEQQRLIHDTATLAKDLRQTLYEVERERDMERIETKRKIEQMKRTVSHDHHDTKTKVQELQRDLLELREAHAKLRQINEKLRREKDRTEVEREAMRDKFLGSSREHLNHQAKIEKLLEDIMKLKDLSPFMFGESINGNEFASEKFNPEAKPKIKQEFTEALRKLNKTSDELKYMMNFDDRGSLRRTPSLRRLISPESDDEGSVKSESGDKRSSQRPLHRVPKSQLYRKSQSLDHQLAEERGKVWVSETGSTSSIESSATDDAKKRKPDLNRSLDRMSTGSQTSDLDVSNDSAKKGLKGVLSKLGKSKSIEGSNTGGSIVAVGLQAMAPGSGSSIASETEKDSSMKGKLKTLFKKSSPAQTKSPSLDKDGPNVKNLSSRFEVSTSSASPTLKPTFRR